jgi:hypothetical protein
MSDFQKEIFKLEGNSESTNLMIYADSNVGKTVLAGTAPGKTFWLVGEPGYKSAPRMGATGYGRRVGDTAAAWAAVEWLEYRERYQKFDWIILDGISTMQDRFRIGYANEAFDINPTKRQHRNLPDKPDYFNTQNMLKAWIPRLVDMPVNLLITAHAWRTEDYPDVDMYVFPGIQGKNTETANAISGLMDAVGYYEKKRIRSRDGGKSRLIRRLHWESPDTGKKGEEVKYLVGDKFNCLGPYMNNPTMAQIIAKIDGESEE